ncbi:MAG: hypothetical protein H0V66_11705 [Bdellovibrionales bacterium]|nr:hypothetical protein [Bdellovibrionales bacterium]
MGTVLGEMNDWPMARFHFILAEASGFHSEELNQNQKLIEAKLEVSKHEEPAGTSDYLIKAGFIAAEGPLLSLGFLFLVVGLWILKRAPTLKNAAIFVIAVATPLMLDLWIGSWPRKIVTSTKIIYEGPSALFGSRGELPQGLMILTNTKGDWEKIIFPSRFAGWIKPDSLKRLELE